MRKVLLIIGMVVCHHLQAQIQAVTSNGEEVLLYDDGTWKYASPADTATMPIPVNSTKYSKAPEASFLVKSNINKAGVYIDTKKWSFSKGEPDGATEYSFKFKANDLYAMLINERISVPIESLKKLAFQNAKQAAPDVRITMEDLREVNGKQVLCMQMDGTIEGIKFTYLGYYYSWEEGSVQLLSYTTQNIFKEAKPHMESFLNGFVIGQ